MIDLEETRLIRETVVKALETAGYKEYHGSIGTNHYTERFNDREGNTFQVEIKWPVEVD